MGKSVIVKNYINYIDKIISNNKVSHAYLFEINDYDKDFKYILDFVKMILCNISYEEISSSDNNIINLIDSNNYPDIKIIEPDGSTIKKGQLLDLQKDYNNKSLLDGKRIYIIKNAEKLNPASGNTILKFLEEPEEDIIAFLVTDNRYHVLETILSRCQVLTLKEDNLSFEEDDDILDLLKCVVKPKDFFIKYNYFLSNVLVDKNIALEKFKIIENIIVSYLNYEYCDNSIDDKIISILKDSSTDKLLLSLSIFEEEIPRLEFNVNFKLWLDSLFSRLVNGG